MWSIFTYAYNTILVLFIASHLMVGALISFLAGLYLGIYLTQNYSIPRISQPNKLWDKVVPFMEKHRLRNIRPSNVLSLVREQEDEQNQEQPPVIQASLQLHSDNPFAKTESRLLSCSNHLD